MKHLIKHLFPLNQLITLTQSNFVQSAMDDESVAFPLNFSYCA